MLMSRFLAIDYGLKRIGLAISDEMKIIASPIETLKTPPKMIDTVLEILMITKKYTIEKVVVGIPLKLNGSSSFMTDEVKAFIECFQEKTSIPVVQWDERLSSMQAEKTLKETRLTRKKRSQKVDAVAAVIILQSYLDYERSSFLN